MDVLVTAASKHGSTREIADAIGTRLRERGFAVEVVAPDDVATLADVQAVVLGSAVYAGHWLAPAREFADRFAHALRQRPVWLFSSGPVGDPPAPREDAVRLADTMEVTGARSHALFGGRIVRSRLGFAERAMVRALGVAEGDCRDWRDIDAWADEVADVLVAESQIMGEAKGPTHGG